MLLGQTLTSYRIPVDKASTLMLVARLNQAVILNVLTGAHRTDIWHLTKLESTSG